MLAQVAAKDNQDSFLRHSVQAMNCSFDQQLQSYSQCRRHHIYYDASIDNSVISISKLGNIGVGTAKLQSSTRNVTLLTLL